MSCTKTAEPIEMQSGVYSQMGPGTIVLYGDVDDPHGNGHFSGLSGRLKNIVKERILGVG